MILIITRTIAVILNFSKLFGGQGFSIPNVTSNYKDPEPSVSLTETSHSVYFN